MNTIKLNKKDDYLWNELVVGVKTWEKIKKAGDEQLYKKFNKDADYEELRIYIGENEIDLDGHCLKKSKIKYKKTKSKVKKIKW